MYVHFYFMSLGNSANRIAKLHCVYMWETKKLVVFSRFLFLGSGGGLVLCFTKSMSEDGPQSCAEDSSDHVAFSRTY